MTQQAHSIIYFLFAEMTFNLQNANAAKKIKHNTDTAIK
jgi:hypothetical protein